jgi:hypothetical protein
MSPRTTCEVPHAHGRRSPRHPDDRRVQLSLRIRTRQYFHLLVIAAAACTSRRCDLPVADGMSLDGLRPSRLPNAVPREALTLGDLRFGSELLLQLDLGGHGLRSPVGGGEGDVEGQLDLAGRKQLRLLLTFRLDKELGDPPWNSLAG